MKVVKMVVKMVARMVVRLEVRLVVVSGQLGPVQQLPAVFGQLLLQLSYAP